jgi:hypothetical protein
MVEELDVDCLTYLPALADNDNWKKCLAELAGIDPDDLDLDLFRKKDKKKDKKDNDRHHGKNHGHGRRVNDSSDLAGQDFGSKVVSLALTIVSYVLNHYNAII